MQRLQLDGFEIEATDSVDDAQPRPDRPLGIVLLRSRVAEIGQTQSPMYLATKPSKPATTSATAR